MRGEDISSRGRAWSAPPQGPNLAPPLATAVPMRLAIPTLAAFLLLAAAPALAHDTHGPCSMSKSIGKGDVVHVDVYGYNCLGATVWSPYVYCAFPDVHVLMGLHTPVLAGPGCETGVILSPTETHLLP